AHLRHHEAGFERVLLAECRDAVHQLNVASAHEPDQVLADLELHWLYGQLRVHVLVGGLSLALRTGLLLGSAPPGLEREESQCPDNQRQEERRSDGYARQRHHDDERDEHEHEYSRVGGGLLHDFRAQPRIGRRARNDDAGTHRNDQRRNLRDDTVTDREQRVELQRLAPWHAALRDPDGEAADDVDQQNDDAGDGVALDELARAVHGTVEVRLLLEVHAPPLRLFLVDKTHVQVSVYAHLLAGHAVQGEAGCHLGDALRAVGDHHVLHHHQDQEHDETDDVVAAHHVGPDRGDHPSCVRVAQDEPRGGDVDRQTEQRRAQEERGEGRELDGLLRVEGDEQYEQREAEVGEEQQVE